MIQRVSAIAGWLALAFIVYATLSPIDARPVLASPHREHFAAFALVGLAFGLAYPNRLLLVIVIVVGAAAGLEALPASSRLAGCPDGNRMGGCQIPSLTASSSRRMAASSTCAASILG